MQPGIDFFISFTTIKLPDLFFFMISGYAAIYVGGLIMEKSPKQTVYSSFFIPIIFNDIIHELLSSVSEKYLFLSYAPWVNSVCLNVVVLL